MTMNDSHGHELTGASAEARDHYERALRLLKIYSGDPLVAADAATTASPSFAMAHLLKAWLNLLGTEPAGIPAAREAHDAAAPHAATAREKGHLAAVHHLVHGRWHEASQALLRVSADHPHDLLALQVGHQLDFFTGNARLLRDRIARALPQWSPDSPDYHALLGMHAFGLEETGDYPRAERQGKRAIELQPRDAWAQHAVAHVLEMQGRTEDGVAWMRRDSESWSRDSFFAVHNWWHLALYHLDREELDEVWALYDGPIFGAKSNVALDLVDASALLWRLHLRGVPVGERWQAVADNWGNLLPAGLYAFNDAHMAMAFIGAGRADALQGLLETQDKAMNGTGDNASFTRDVGRPVTLALRAFADGDYGRCTALLGPVIPIAHRFGGSHAQRDLLDLTLVEAALRGGDRGLARAVAAERLQAKPHGRHARSLAERAGLQAQRA